MQSPTSPGARALIDKARAFAAQRSTRPSTLHLLGAAFDLGGEVGAKLRARGLRVLDVRQALRTQQEPEGAFGRVEPRARRVAQAQGSPVITEAHLLVAALSDPESAAVGALIALKQDPSAIAAELALPALAPPARAASTRASIAIAQGQRPTPQGPAPSSLLSRAKLSPVDARRVNDAPAPQRPTARPRGRDARAEGFGPRATPLLFGLMLPHATQGEAPTVLGRDELVERLRDALGRRGGRGALLCGPSGGGRSAVVRAMAARASMPVVRLPHAELVAAMRGPQAERFRALGEELGRARGEAVLVLDPLLPWLNPRDTPEDVVLELRAQLSSATVPWVGVVTSEEARRLSESEPWLERAAVRLELDELPPEVMHEVLSIHARSLAKHHEVALDEGVAQRAFELSERYLGGRAQPDRTIAVLDLAASRARRRSRASLGRETVAEVIAELGGVPHARVASTDGERLVALESHLGSRIVGHAEVRARVSHVIRRNAVGFRGARPMGTFLFLGPTGVGKTETARAVAEQLFPGAGGLVRLDMAEYSEAHAVARLVGAPPGYVGYGDGGLLSEAVRRKPWCVVLLDEVEKAHRDVLEALLGVLDEGRLTDGRGRTTDFRNTVIIMTSNLGAEHFVERSRSIGFGRADGADGVVGKVLATARASMPPELWNRIDEPVVFAPLRREEVAEVADRMLRDASKRLCDEQGITLEWDHDVLSALLDGGGFDPALGARPMRRTIARMVESPVAEAVLSAVITRGDRARLEAREGDVAVRRA